MGRLPLRRPRRVSPAGEARDLLELLGASSGIALPLRGRDRILGVLTLSVDAPRTPTDAELVTAREVADRAGLALDNARLFSEQRQLAEELQRGLLTDPFQHERADWYVATTPPPRRPWDSRVGCCAGSPATATAARRGTARAGRRDEPAGAQHLRDRGRDPLRADRGGGAARSDPDAVEQRRAPAVAGDPPRRHTLAALADWKGELLLGVDAAVPRLESVVTLDGGTTVLLCTDGLIERRGGHLDDGMARLRTAATDLAGASQDDLCDELLDRLVHGRPEDDVALVAIRLRA